MSGLSVVFGEGERLACIHERGERSSVAVPLGLPRRGCRRGRLRSQDGLAVPEASVVGQSIGYLLSQSRTLWQGALQSELSATEFVCYSVGTDGAPSREKNDLPLGGAAVDFECLGRLRRGDGLFVGRGAPCASIPPRRI